LFQQNWLSSSSRRPVNRAHEGRNLTRTLCPFFKEDCHGNECIMWKNEECLLVSFLQHMSEGVELPETGIPLQEEAEAEASKWLKTSTPEEVAVEILDFKRKEFPEEESFGFHSIPYYYWSQKGIEKSVMPPEILMKMEKAELLAEREIRKDEENQRKGRLKKEKEELPSLVSRCVDFARMNGLKKLRISDVDSFVMEKDLDLMDETKRAIYANANVKLKSGKLEI